METPKRIHTAATENHATYYMMFESKIVFSIQFANFAANAYVSC